MILDTIITYLQVFGIGFSFGIAGPCFFFCTPILITYILGRKEGLRDAISDILVFLWGRLTAYVILGVLAGISGGLIRHIAQGNLGRYLNPLGGGVSILLGIFVILYGRSPTCACNSIKRRTYGFGSLFLLGFAMGFSPCAPLSILLLQIALMSRSGLEGGAYAFFFGMGTLVSGVIAIGAFAGLLGGVFTSIIKSKRGNTLFRWICGILLILFGIWNLYRHYLYI